MLNATDTAPTKHKEVTMKTYTMQFIPCGFPAFYTMRAETIRQWIGAIAFIGIIVFVLTAMLWGTP